MRSVTLTLPYPVSANRYWNSFVLGKRVMVAPSNEAKKYKKEVVKIALLSGITEPIKGRVRVDMKVYPQRPQDWQKRSRLNGLGWDDTVRCLDIDNCRKCVYDSLKGIVFEDDKWVFYDTGERMEPDGEARVVVTVTEIQFEQTQKSFIEEL